MKQTLGRRQQEKTPLPQCQQKPRIPTPPRPHLTLPQEKTPLPECPQTPQVSTHPIPNPIPCHPTANEPKFHNLLNQNMSENLICFPVLQTLPALPKWFYFLLSKGNHQPRLKLVSCPTPMKALSGVSRLQVLQNEGVWSPTGRKMQSVESQISFFLFLFQFRVCSGNLCSCVILALCSPCRPLTHIHKNNKT